MYNRGVDRRHLRALIALLVVATLPIPLAAGQDARRLIFRAEVSELWLRASSSYAKDRRPGDCVEVALPGRLNRPPLPVVLIERRAADWSAPERALASIRSANTAGDREWILQNFPPDEQAHIRPLLDDAVLVKRNQEHYRAILGLEITGSAELRGYTVLLTREELGEGRTRTVPVTLAKTASGWKQTNALSADETFDVVWAALRAGKIRGGTLGSC